MSGEKSATEEEARKAIEEAAAKLRRERGIPSAWDAKKLADDKRKKEEDARVADAQKTIADALGSEVLADEVRLGFCGGGKCSVHQWWDKFLKGLDLHPYHAVMIPGKKGALFPGLWTVSLVLDQNVSYIQNTLGKRATVPPMEDPDTADLLKKRSKKE